MAAAAGHVSEHQARQMVSGVSRRSLAADIMTDLQAFVAGELIYSNRTEGISIL